MIKSMTGFGRGEAANEYGRITVEIKAVNHRYLDLNIKLPRMLNGLENEIRSDMKQRISRGKVDVAVTLTSNASSTVVLSYNPVLAEEYISYFQKISEQFDLKNDMTVSKLVRCPDVLVPESREQETEQQVKELLQEALHIALDQFMQSRAAEGEQLKQDLLTKLAYMNQLTEQMTAYYPQVLADYRERLLNKVKELLGDAGVDENRVATEVVVYADKTCIDEETVRLCSHIRQMADILETQETVGRKLDFLAQEMNREANTMLSKTNDMAMTDIAIDLKTEIEKIREQIQNLE